MILFIVLLRCWLVFWVWLIFLSRIFIDCGWIDIVCSMLRVLMFFVFCYIDVVGVFWKSWVILCFLMYLLLFRYFIVLVRMDIVCLDI